MNATQKNAVSYKGVFYFAEYKAAHSWAVNNQWPTDRIIPYELGYAVQACESGRYAGPNEPPYMPGETWSNPATNE